MSDNKPKYPKEYKEWLRSEHKIEIDGRTRTHYESVTRKIKQDFESSDFWKVLKNDLREYNDKYHIDTGYDLFEKFDRPELLIKPFDSFLLKTFRKNIRDNKNWPQKPPGGWILPRNWFSRINDVLRTLFFVKYLDGVEFFARQLESLCDDGLSFSKTFEAREEGYYAAHIYVRRAFEIPRVDWDTESVNCSVEIQISTQLQEVIRTMLHKYYEERRVGVHGSRKWQWDYKSDEFAANYLGHILHYLEGMIMEVREKQKGHTDGIEEEI